MGENEKWILLAEDDRLFAKLFVRFWSEAFPQIRIRIVTSNKEGVVLLQNSESRPALAVLDLNLSDGSSEELRALLQCPSVTWSAVPGIGEAAPRQKPVGRAGLVEAVKDLGRIGQLDVPLQ